jgi:hypothetical protein
MLETLKPVSVLSSVKEEKEIKMWNNQEVAHVLAL